MNLTAHGVRLLIGTSLLWGAAVLSATETAAPAPSAAQDSDIQTALRELERGRDQLYAGQFDAAAASFKRAAKAAPVNSSVASQAAEHAEFRLPIARAQRWLLRGDRERAETELRAAVAVNGQHPERVGQLNEMLANLAALPAAQTGPQALGLDNATVVAAARATLEGFFQRTGRYPDSAAEVAATMRDAPAPLDGFEVIRFGGTGSGYLLVLRNRQDPAHVITIQKTGLLR